MEDNGATQPNATDSACAPDESASESRASSRPDSVREPAKSTPAAERQDSQSSEDRRTDSAGDKMSTDFRESAPPALDGQDVGDSRSAPAEKRGSVEEPDPLEEQAPQEDSPRLEEAVVVVEPAPVDEKQSTEKSSLVEEAILEEEQPLLDEPGVAEAENDEQEDDGAHVQGVPLDQWVQDDSVTPGVTGEVERYLKSLFRRDNYESASRALDELSRRGMEGVQFASDLIGELVGSMTGVESFKVIPRPPMEFEVEIKSKREQTFTIKQAVAPMVELRAVRFGKRVSFGAKVDTRLKAIRINISEGLSFIFHLGPLLGIQPVEIKGTGILKRNERGQIVLMTTVPVPGLDIDLDITVPLSLLFRK